MPNANYTKGRRWEYALKKQWEANGYMVLRTAGSHGPFDLVAIKNGCYIALIQAKVCATEAEAKRLQAAFQSSPPLSQSGHCYEQFICIKVDGGKVYEAGVY